MQNLFKSIYFNMDKNVIVFIDSGLGGISTLSNLLKMKSYNIVYYADNKFCPYGSLSKKQLQGRLKTIILELKRLHNPIGFVLACNTATTSSISYLRQEFKDDIFIGTEPAVSLSIKQGFKKPLLIATPQTVKCYKKTNQTKALPLKNFARNIESYLLNNSSINYYLLLKDILYIKKHSKNHDCIVLGCTHYALIYDILSKFINIPMLDGNNGVANEICRKLNKIEPHNKDFVNIKFKFSNPLSQLKENYEKILKQILANQ